MSLQFVNTTGRPAAWALGFQADGRERLTVIAKSTYRMPLAGEQVELGVEQQPLIEADRFTGEPGLSAPVLETDFAHTKPRCDVIVVGHATAPAGQAVQHLTVGLRVGTLLKQLQVSGRRHWRSSLLGWHASEPEAFQRLPLSYDLAYGGTDRTHEAEGRTRTFEANPVGMGHWPDRQDLAGLPLPCLEPVGEHLSSPLGQVAPVSLSPVGRNWLPRRRLAGTYDEHWVTHTAPLWPADFDEAYFQCAPPDQQMPFPVGGEPVVLQHLSAEGRRAFHLPVAPLPVTFVPHQGRALVQQAVIDTIVLEPDAQRFTLTYRSTLALGRSFFDVKEIVVGELSRAQLRRRQFPGKRHYPSLAEAVAELGRARRRGP